MRLLTISVLAVSLFSACELPSSPKDDSSATGPLVTATISDGTGAFSHYGTTSVTAWTAGMVQASVAAIEVVAPLRQIQIIVYCNATDVGVPIALNDVNAANQAQGLYGNASQGFTYSGPAAGTSGTVTFDNLTLGDNTLSGTFSFVAKRADGTTVTVSAGTFGK